MEEMSKMTLEDWLDDLSVRFIINLPEGDLTSVARICFQVEEAQWFYEDFVRPLDPQLPSLPLRLFCLKMFQHCPLLASFSEENHMRAFDEFMNYKTRVPVRGAIMLNQDMDSAVLVRGWKKNSGWSFPRGKINKDEDDLECAIREVDEETGFDIREAGLVPKGESVKYIEVPMRAQNIRLYVIRGVPMDTKFQPRTRKEISKIDWWKLSDLPAFKKKKDQDNNQPNGQDSHNNSHNNNNNNNNHNGQTRGQTRGQNHHHHHHPQAQDAKTPSMANNSNKFYMVAPFLGHLRKWIWQQKKRDAAAAAAAATAAAAAAPPAAATVAAESGPASAAAATAATDFPASLPPATALAEEPMEPATEDDARTAGIPGSRPPDSARRPDTGTSLEDTTRELQRLWNKQPQPPAAQGVQGVHQPTPDSAGGQDKGASLLALLQQPSPAPPAQPAHPPVPPHQAMPTAMPHQPHAAPNPAWGYHSSIAHPQPLPPRARSLLVPANGPSDQAARQTRTSGSQPTNNAPEQQQRQGRVHLVPHPAGHGVENLVSVQKYENPRQHPQFLQATAMPSPPQILSRLFGDPKGGMPSASGPHGVGGPLAHPQPPSLPLGPLPQGSLAHGPLSQGPLPHGPPSHAPLPHGPLPQGSLSIPSAAKLTVPIDKHRSALLSMFKKSDSSLSASLSPQVSAAKPQMPPPSSTTTTTTGEDIHRGLLSLLPRSGPTTSTAPRPHTGSPSVAHMAHHHPPRRPSGSTNQPYADPRLSSLANNAKTMSMGGSPVFGAVYAGASPATNPSVLASPPAASSFPVPGILQQPPLQHSSTHKQKLLSLFNDNNNNSTPPVASASLASGANNNNAEPAFSSADRNFLLGYLESVTKNAK